MAVKPPRLESVWFDHRYGSGQFGRLADVLEYSAKKYNPDWDVAVRRVKYVEPKTHNEAKDWHRVNMQKIDEWAAIVQRSSDGDRIVLIDGDTFINQPLDSIWDTSFDIALTTKEAPESPCSTGVIFLRSSQHVRAFFRLWRDRQHWMMQNKAEHFKWRAIGRGINQSSLAEVMLRYPNPNVRILGVPCYIWNNAHADWHRYAPDRTKILHIHYAMRMLILEGKPLAQRYWNAREQCEQMREAWLSLEKELLGDDAPPVVPIKGEHEQPGPKKSKKKKPRTTRVDN